MFQTLGDFGSTILHVSASPARVAKVTVVWLRTLRFDSEFRGLSAVVTRPVSPVSTCDVGDGVGFCRESRKTVRFKVKTVRFMCVLVRRSS